LYLAQFFKENLPYVELTLKYLNKLSIEQYQAEERTLIAYRLAAARYRVMDLLNIMSKDQISTNEKVVQLSGELGEFFNSRQIKRCKTMGEIVKQTMRHILKPYMARIQRNIGKVVDE
jgi:transposase